ncbi:hypothetical protein F383_07056 [Gossypium arboreum]|uniref:Uncharacterized protein n=1 Tax=Gossypium arboreum TaxID=29729 RepID=A0A0B0PI90_GOSAR|nr:hypothetical protein F383_07056 [Gossypium arboreum]
MPPEQRLRAFLNFTSEHQTRYEEIQHRPIPVCTRTTRSNKVFRRRCDPATREQEEQSPSNVDK